MDRKPFVAALEAAEAELAQQKQALLAYQQAIQNGIREVEDALVSQAKYRQQLEAQRERVRALREYVRLARLRYDNGYTSYLEVLDSERSLFNAELSTSQNQADVLAALIDVYKSVGGGWVKEAETITQPKLDPSVSEAVDEAWQQNLKRE